MNVGDVAKVLVGGIAVYAAMAACSSNGVDAESVADAATVNTSGGRLKVRYYEGTDGSRQFAGFYDTLRKEVCNFTPLTGAEVYCVPFAAVNSAEFFRDNSCLEGLTLPPQTGIDYVRFGLSVRKYGQRYDGKVYVRSSGGDFVEYAPGVVLFTLGEEIPVAQFVSAKVVEETR